ncbi:MULTISPECIES: hypothetical protein [Providencia]|uniref:hypothetical protein n=1 Tax=Providencia TaxID=586 RepID=UPI001122D797|nr:MULTISPECIES: hypothetical protein [Providencia]TNV04401.1 hypothetical protein FH869_05785 [Providencia rettgeri]
MNNMNDIDEVNELFERAEDMKERVENYISVTDGLNRAQTIQLEDERGIDIDSRRWISIDDIDYGEENLRVKEEVPNVDSAIGILDEIIKGEVSDDLDGHLREVRELLDSVESTLDECNESSLMNDDEVSDDYYYENENEDEDEDEDEY